MNTSLYARRRHPASDGPKAVYRSQSLSHLIAIVTRTLFILLVLSTLSCSKNDPQTAVFQGSTMGTTYTVKVVVPPGKQIPEDLQQQIDSTLVEFNLIMSTYISDSELSRLNRAPENAWVSVGTSLFFMLDMSKQLSELTEGAFDVTVGPLVNLWGFGPDKHETTVPAEELLEEARARVGNELFELDAEMSAINRKADIYIDLSAIAKGYGADVVADLLSSNKIDNFMVEIGGELFLKGRNANDQLWSIGVEKPSLAHEGAVQAIQVSNAGVATSGDYRNYVEVDGQRFSHTIDPATGKPITHNLASVTVIAPSGAEADALATAINVMGPEKGMAFAEKFNLAIYMLVREGEGFVSKHTSAFEKYLNPETE